MKKFYESDASLSELRAALKNITKKKSDNTIGIIFAIACIIILTAAVIFISLKLKANHGFAFDDDFDDEYDDDEYDDDFSDDDADDVDFDENGCRFVAEKDLEK